MRRQQRLRSLKQVVYGERSRNPDLFTRASIIRPQTVTKLLPDNLPNRSASSRKAPRWSETWQTLPSTKLDYEVPLQALRSYGGSAVNAKAECKQSNVPTFTSSESESVTSKAEPC